MLQCKTIKKSNFTREKKCFVGESEGGELIVFDASE